MQCCICLQEALKPRRLFCCGNDFCSSCLSQWTQVRNVCPLCGTLIGDEQVNKLKSNGNEEFDNGFMMMEFQISELNEKITSLRKRLNAKREQAKCLKSNIRMDHFSFLENQMYLVEEYYHIAQDSMSRGDRVTCVNHIQLIAEISLKMEAVFDGQTIEEIQYQYQDEFESQQDEDYEELEELEWKWSKKSKSQKREPKTSFTEKKKSKKKVE